MIKSKQVLWHLSLVFALLAGQAMSFPFDNEYEKEGPPTYYYAIIAPSQFRPNHDYVILLQTQNLTQKANALIQLLQTDGVDKKPLPGLKRELQLDGDQRIDTVFQVPSLEEGEYFLNVNLTVGNRTHSHLDQLTLVKKDQLLLLQADKTLYKQGETVKFRALVLDPESRPRSQAVASFFINDPKGNRIQQWLNTTVDQFGQFSNELSLSPNAMLGKYQINMESNEEQRQYSIEVSEYVLPQFSVDIIMPKFITYDEPKLPVVVEAKYTHGKFVKGTANITLRQKYFYQSEEAEFWPDYEPLREVSIQKKIHGKTEVEFDTLNQLRMRHETYDTTLEVEVIVFEEVTGKNFTKSETLQMTSRGVRFELVSTSDDLKPGLTFFGILKFVTFDGQPVNDPKNSFTYGYRFDTETNFTEASSLPPHSVISLNIPVPTNARKLFVRALYKGMRFSLPAKYARHSKQDNLIQFVPLDPTSSTDRKEIEVNPSDNQIHVTLETNRPVKDFNYLVVARGEILHAGQFENEKNQSINDIFIPFKPSMKSGFRLLVYVFNQSSLVVEDTAYVPTQKVLSSLNLTLSTNSTKTGENVTLTAIAQPNTFVAVVGIDQSMILLRKPNYIDLDQFKEQSEYISSRPSRRFYGYYSPGFDEVFYRSKLFLRTNTANRGNSYIYPVSLRATTEIYADSGAPAMAMAMAAPSRAPYGKRSSFQTTLPKLALRKDFPETWLWDAKVTDNQTGVAEFNSKVPDTITSWVINAFGVNAESGLALPEKPLHLTVFNPFFIKVNLPYSIVRGEQTSIQVLIHNYLGQGTGVEVTLFNELNEFTFIQPTVNANKTTDDTNEISEDEEDDDQANQINEPDQTQQTLQVFSKADDVVSVSFPIQAKQVGHIRLQLIARTLDNTAGDKIEKLLLVKAEGQTQRFNKAVLVSLNSTQTTFEEQVSIQIPEDAVNGSRLITVSAVGDVMGNSLSNLDDLLRVPYGCGEQNMALLVPNIVALEYLNKTSRLNSRLQRKALNNLHQGYQRQLNYQRLDGGFSAFGEKDRNGSTWLTAFVVTSFLKAQKFITIDPNVFNKSIEFLLNKTNKDGGFDEYGFVYDKGLMGGVDRESKDALSAYVLTALIRSVDAGLLNESSISNSLAYFEKLIDQIPNDVQKDQLSKNAFYTLSLVSYALQMRNSSRSEKAFQTLWLLHQVDSQGNVFFDKEPKNETNSQNSNDRLYYSYLYRPNTHAVEATAYALLTATLRQDTTKGLQLLSWLISKQNQYGGMVSTQDTVVSLTAFASFAGNVYKPQSNVQINFQSISSETNSKPVLQGQFNLNAENSLVVHQGELGERGFEQELASLKGVSVQGSGDGIAVAQVSWQYNVVKKADNGPFNVTAKVSTSDPHTKQFQLEVCTAYTVGGESNMAIVEVNTPSGFVFDSESLDDLRRQRADIKRIDVGKEDTEASFYFDKITSQNLCFTIEIYRNSPVGKLKPALVYVYDYYQKQNAARTFYRVKGTNPCDLCENHNCRLKCANKLLTTSATETGNSTSLTN